jgi:hypothetical protein
LAEAGSEASPFLLRRVVVCFEAVVVDRVPEWARIVNKSDIRAREDCFSAVFDVLPKK